MATLFKTSNKSVIFRTKQGAEVIVVQNKPVAGYSPELGYFKVASVRSSKHLRAYLTGVGEVGVVSQAVVDEIYIKCGRTS